MSLEALTSTHQIQKYRLTQTSGPAMENVWVWGSPVGNLDCRIVPVSAKDVLLWQQRGKTVTHNLHFSSDPGVDENNGFSYLGRKFEFRGIRNADELGELWIVTVEERYPQPPSVS